MHNSPFNILVAGVGGQGTVLAGKLLAACALDSGAVVRSAETIGMAQRGGSVLGHVRIAPGDAAQMFSPLISAGQAQVLIGFEPSETLRATTFCAEDAIVISASKPLASPLASLQHISYDGSQQLAALENKSANGEIGTFFALDNDAIMQKLGFDKALNVVLLGAALGALEQNNHFASTFLSYEAMHKTITDTVKQQFIEANLQALEMGYQHICK